MKLSLREFIRRSIKYKIISVFLVIILLMLLLSLFFMFFQIEIINSYKEVIDKMLLEKELSKTVPLLIEDYNYLGKNIDNAERMQKYKTDYGRIEAILSDLDKMMTTEESIVIYRGLKNIINGIMSDCDKGIEDIKKGDISTYSLYYNEASRKSYYVDLNTAQLLAQEVEITKTTQERLQTTNKISMIAGLSIIIIITLGSIIFSFVFSRTLIRPLENLLNVVESVKSGNLNARSLNTSEDEIGRLGVSFNTMIETIDNSEKELNLKTDNLNRSKEELEKKIDELEKFQKITLGRELKMIDLKNKIKTMEDTAKEEKQK